jgi:hypothetical protein
VWEPKNISSEVIFIHISLLGRRRNVPLALEARARGFETEDHEDLKIEPHCEVLRDNARAKTEVLPSPA